MNSETASTFPSGFGVAAREAEDDLGAKAIDWEGNNLVSNDSDDLFITKPALVAPCVRPDRSDECLLARTCEGDREALGLLFHRYARLVRTVAQRILRDPSEAEDLLQEVFLFVFRRAALFDPQRASARSWLVQVTWHRAIDRRRYLMTRHFYTNLELEEAVVAGGEPGTEAGPYERTMEGALGKEALRRIDESLSEDQRRVLRLHFFEGHTLAEIAALLGQTPGNVRNHYYRALEKMRAQVFREKLHRK